MAPILSRCSSVVVPFGVMRIRREIRDYSQMIHFRIAGLAPCSSRTIPFHFKAKREEIPNRHKEGALSSRVQLAASAAIPTPLR